jgi:hypothetical protein
MVIRGWRVELVFDVAQTDPLPGAVDIAVDLTADIAGPMPEQLHGSGPEALWRAVGRLIVAEGWTLRDHPRGLRIGDLEREDRPHPARHRPAPPDQDRLPRARAHPVRAPRPPRDRS